MGVLSNSLDEMTNELNKRISTAENYSTDLLHEIRNPLASLKSASDIISETENKELRSKLVGIVSHDVERIERLITDYSQMLKDEAAISSERMKKINLSHIAKSVVDDFNSIYESKRSIRIKLKIDNNNQFNILGIENRIEQIIANLLENSISFSENPWVITITTPGSAHSILRSPRTTLWLATKSQIPDERDLAALDLKKYAAF